MHHTLFRLIKTHQVCYNKIPNQMQYIQQIKALRQLARQRCRQVSERLRKDANRCLGIALQLTSATNQLQIYQNGSLISQ